MEFEHIEEIEAVKIASLIEKNGFSFYTSLSKRAEDKAIKDILIKLAADEKKHINLLEKKFYSKAGLGEQITEEELDVEDYVEKNIHPAMFTKNVDMNRIINAIGSIKKAIILAINVEKQAGDFFDVMAKKAETEKGRTMYKMLADEERGHQRQLENILKDMK
ncbi:MAG: ferritin family protein [Deltaproteobacteria bacterium]|nr:ferritin family protein [Deltaproteobacteria bacterium]